MTTYTTIANTEIDQDSPVTQPLMTALRDNPIAIAEADSSVAADLLPTVLLGTITTTSGTSLSLTSLTLTPYKQLLLVFDGVSTSGSSGTIQIAGQNAITISAVSDQYYGHAWIDLATGVGSGVLDTAGIGAAATSFNTSLSTASTSVTISSSSPAFDAGQVKVYGVK